MEYTIDMIYNKSGKLNTRFILSKALNFTVILCNAPVFYNLMLVLHQGSIVIKTM